MLFQNRCLYVRPCFSPFSLDSQLQPSQVLTKIGALSKKRCFRPVLSHSERAAVLHSRSRACACASGVFPSSMLELPLQMQALPSGATVTSGGHVICSFWKSPAQN